MHKLRSPYFSWDWLRVLQIPVITPCGECSTRHHIGWKRSGTRSLLLLEFVILRLCAGVSLRFNLRLAKSSNSQPPCQRPQSPRTAKDVQQQLQPSHLLAMAAAAEFTTTPRRKIPSRKSFHAAADHTPSRLPSSTSARSHGRPGRALS